MNPGHSVILRVSGLESGYSHLQVLWGLSVQVAEGQLVALLGPNGAGKTTTLRTIAGLLKPKSGSVIFRGAEIAGRPPHEISRLGIRFIPEDLKLFSGMSVEENLVLGAYTIRDRRRVRDQMDAILSTFPVLAERRKQPAGALSGGEQRMLALGRGLMSQPEFLLVDEPSLGLAPKAARAVLEMLHTLKENGITILLVEQNVQSTLEISDRAYLLDQGHVVLEGSGADLRQNELVSQTYFGNHGSGAKE
jgi:branched-chain amino acid transport system ATP-binding protein